MSADREAARRVATRVHRWAVGIGRAVFGDRVGLVLFLGALSFFVLYWRVGVFINDSYAVLNALPAVADGHLWIEQATVGPLDAPGTYAVDGRAYARNYGEVYLAVPVLWLVRGVARVADLHVALIALWHLLVLALVLQCGRLVDRERLARLGGSGLVVVSFVLNLLLAVELPETAPVLVSLQLVAMVVAGLAAVFLYRLLDRYHGTRLAVGAGAAVALATPVGFWAAIPKRHVFTVAVVLGVLFAVAASREDGAGTLSVPGLGAVPVARGMAYALVGLYASVHAAEALGLLGALVIVDLATAPRNDLRSLAFVGLCLAASVIPFLLTNLAISGDPFAPPRTLPDLVLEQSGNGTSVESGSSAAGGAFGGGESGGGGGGGGGLPAIEPALRPFGQLYDYYETGAWTAVNEPGDVFRTLIRSAGGTDLDGQLRFRAGNLSVLESAPILAAVVLAPVALGAALVRRGRAALDSLAATDLLAGLFALSFLLLYLPRLPLHVQVTSRYLLVLFPLVVYGIARLSPIRRIVSTAGAIAAWTYAASVLVGGQLFLVAVVVQDLAVAEALSLHGAVNLVVAGLLVVALALATVDERFDPLGGVALGLAAGAGTVLVLLTGLYFAFVGPYALPVVEAIGDLVAVA